MTSDTAARIDLVLATLRERQARGDAPPPGQVTPDVLARLSIEIGHPVSRSTWQRLESVALRKARLALAALGAASDLRP